MNKQFIISIVVLISFFGLVAFWPKTTCDASGVGCRPSSQSQTKQPKAEIIQSKLQNNTALLIDVREPDEFAADHAVAHLLYSRFWMRFFYKLGLVPTPRAI